MSPAARLFGAVSLAVVFLALEALVVGYRGLRPATFHGVEIGAQIGLGSLVLEINVVERAMRSVAGDVANATFQTFAMRLAIVAPLTFAFQRSGSSVDGTSFAVSYLVTFFVYLCWLTWKTYHMPVQYRGKGAKFAPRVVEKRRETEVSGCGSMIPLLASGDPFKHTWNTWEIDLVFTTFDLRTVPGFERLGITNAVVMMFVVALLLLFVGIKSGNEAKRALAEGRTPRGLGHLVEVLVDFVRDQIVRPQMPHHFEKGFFNAYFCTLFFFILFCNLIGLVPAPFGHTPTGTFLLNAGLAFGCTFFVIVGSGFYEHGPKWIVTGFVPHGVPLWLSPLIWLIEVIGMFIKPFSLTIRLTANMTAGHIILAVLMGFLTVALDSVVVSGLVKTASGFGYLAISAFEIAIAFIQAYIFTMLSAVFVGASLSHEH